MRLQNGVGPNFHFLKAEKLKLRKTVDYLTGTTKNEPKMWKNLKLRNF